MVSSRVDLSTKTTSLKSCMIRIKWINLRCSPAFKDLAIPYRCWIPSLFKLNFGSTVCTAIHAFRTSVMPSAICLERSIFNWHFSINSRQSPMIRLYCNSMILSAKSKSTISKWPSPMVHKAKAQRIRRWRIVPQVDPLTLFSDQDFLFFNSPPSSTTEHVPSERYDWTHRRWR